jgi:chaperone required for assembly of F1-ATPase
MELAPEATAERYEQLEKLARDWAYYHGTHVYEGISADIANWVRENHKALIVEDDTDSMINLLEGAKISLGTHNGLSNGDIPALLVLKRMLSTARTDTASLEARLSSLNADYEVDPWEDTAAQIRRVAERVTRRRLEAEALEAAVAKFL